MLQSGELAKRCHVSVRTVQFYDKKGLLKPSDISEGGRRLYDDKAIVKLQQICLYRQLGFTLDEIKEIEESSTTQMTLLQNKIKELNLQKVIVDQQLMDLHTVLQAHTHHEVINDTDTLKNQVQRNHRHYLHRILQYCLIFIVCLLMILILVFMPKKGIGLFVGLLSVIALLLLLIYYHSKTNAYICPRCHTYFELTIWKDMISFNNGRKGKLLRCPSCKRMGSFKEIAPK